MRCSRCGQQIYGNSIFCTKCGQSLRVIPLEKRKWSKLTFALLVVCLAILIIAVKLLFFTKKYDSVLDEAVDAFNKRQVKMSQITEVFMPVIVRETYQDIMEVLEDTEGYGEAVECLPDELAHTIQNFYEQTEEKYGSDVKVTYEIINKERLSKKECNIISESYHELTKLRTGLAALAEGLEECTMLEENDVGKIVKLIKKVGKKLDDYEVETGYLVEVNVDICGGIEDAQEEITVVITKVKGDWGFDYLATAMVQDGMDVDEMLDELEDADLRALNKEWKALAKDMDEIDVDLIEYVLDGILETKNAWFEF